MNKCINVCFVISGDLWGGAESHVYSLAQSFSKILKLHVILFNDKDLAKKLRKIPVEVSIIDEASFTPLQMIGQLYKCIRYSQPDVIHVHGFKENFLCGLVSRFLRIKLVRTHHGKGLLSGKLIHRLIEKINFTMLTDVAIAVSSNLMQYLVSAGLCRKKIHVIHNGLDCASIKLFESAKELGVDLGITDSSFVIGTVGRCVPVKGQIFLIEAATLMLKSIKNAKILILGDGPLLQQFHDIVKQNGLEDKVILPGFKADVARYIQLMDVFVLPSLHEGIPMVLLEAMCIGKPIIATNVGGIPELITHMKNGLLIKEASPKQISDSVVGLYHNMVMSEELVKNSLETIAGEFSIDAITDKTLNVYCQLVA